MNPLAKTPASAKALIQSSQSAPPMTSIVPWISSSDAASTDTESIIRLEVFKFLVVTLSPIGLSVEEYTSPVSGSVRRGEAKL